MKKIIITLLMIAIFTGVCIGATYTIKNSNNGSTTIKGPTQTTTTNLYNNYNHSSTRNEL